MVATQNHNSEKILYEIAGQEYLDLLYEYIEYLKNNSLQGLVLDIDETLSATNVYWYQEMSVLFGNPENLTPEELACKYGLCNNVPYRKDKPEIEEWMHQRRVDNELQKRLPVIGGALETYSHIHDTIVPIVGYLTARPDVVIDGTQHWIKENGFLDLQILIKPSHIQHDKRMTWKVHTLQLLYPYVLGIVDDDPKLADELLDGYEGKVFLYNSIVKNAAHPSVLITPTHQDIIDTISKTFPSQR